MAKPGLAQASRATRQRVARAGGLAVSRDRKHMAKIGRRGGSQSSRPSSRRGGSRSR